jgi:glyoxylate/hydroxypyruvate reductase A
MKIVLLAPQFDCSEAWRAAFVAAIPEVELVDEEYSDVDRIEGAIVDEPPPGQLQQYPNLRFVLSLSAGVDALLADATLPAVPIIRLANAEMAALMREYVSYHVLRLHREFAILEALQRDRRWVWMPSAVPAASRRILVLGLGQLGTAAATTLAALGFQVRGWSRTPKRIAHVECAAGLRSLYALLPETDILVSILPLTSDTRDLLSDDVFRRLPKGASVINVGRGGCLRHDDLLRALDRGHLAHATLDVFGVEPLPENDPLWCHPRVTITPHIAAYPPPETFIRPIADAITRFRAGQAVPMVDRTKGY